MNRPSHVRTASLWASAFVVGALVIIQAGRLPGPAAHGEMAAAAGAYSIITTDIGRGGDTDPYEVVYVIDSRDQVLMVYEIEDARRRQVILRAGNSLETIFRAARP